MTFTIKEHGLELSEFNVFFTNSLYPDIKFPSFEWAVRVALIAVPCENAQYTKRCYSATKPNKCITKWTFHYNTTRSN